MDDEDPWSTEPKVPVEPREATPGADDDAHTTSSYPSDPTVANAGLTEIDTTATIPNGIATDTDTPTTAPPTASVAENAGNAAAEEQWDTKPAGDTGMEDSYEIIPRPTDETDNRGSATPAAPTSTQSWADEAQAAAGEEGRGQVTTNGNDGFQEVTQRGPRQHRGFGPGDRGRGRGRGGFRGRGGERGDFRGRGRGGRGGPPRGDGAPRGGRGD